MTQAVNPVDLAIQEANRLAQQPKTAETTKEITLVNNAPSGAVANYGQVKAPSLDDIQAGAMNVDGYLKVKEFGLLIDSKPNLIDTVKVSIDTTEMQAFDGVRFGNPPVYMKTYDGLSCASGGTWQEALRKASLVDPSARPYKGADIQMTLLEDAKDAKGAVVAEKGTRLGHSTSITNRAELAAFLKEIDKAGLKGQVVDATVGFRKATNAKGQSWGLVTFSLTQAVTA